VKGFPDAGGFVRPTSYPVMASVWWVALYLCAVSAGAEDLYPSKPIHFIVTTAAGGAGDLVARAVADRLSESMRQPVIIENQPAGNGGIAAGQVAKSAPDGYTLMTVVDSTLTINPHLYRNLPYDPFRDFAPVSMVTRLPLVLVTNTTCKPTASGN
jgi:tripartite-type tricarboxylate transporter receptor subunit TctC